MSYFVFVVKIMDKKFTISLQSRYAELWRYNIVVMCGCFDKAGERTDFLSKENFEAKHKLSMCLLLPTLLKVTKHLLLIILFGGFLMPMLPLRVSSRIID